MRSRRPASSSARSTRVAHASSMPVQRGSGHVRSGVGHVGDCLACGRDYGALRDPPPRIAGGSAGDRERRHADPWRHPRQPGVRAPTHRAGYSVVKVPEGWARTTRAAPSRFTDKYNAIRIESRTRASRADRRGHGDARAARAARDRPGLRAGDVTSRQRGPPAPRVLITYQAAQRRRSPSPGKAVVDDVERYEFCDSGRARRAHPQAPQGADNVDPWRIVTDSLRWTR